MTGTGWGERHGRWMAAVASWVWAGGLLLERTSWTSTRPEPKTWAFIALMVAGWAATAWIERRRRVPFDWGPSWWMGLGGPLAVVARLWAPAWGPAAVCLYVLPPVVALFQAAFLAGPWATRVGRRLARGRSLLPVATAAAFVALLAFAFALLAAKGVSSGDEIHYFLQTRSLALDGDLDLMNQIGREDLMAKGPYHHHISAQSRPGEAHSWHPPGICVLLVPLYLAGGAAAMTAGMAAMGALLWMLLVRIGGWSGLGAAPSILLASLVALLLPFPVYAARFYPELAASLALLSAFLLLGRLSPEAGPPPSRAAAWLAAGTLLGLLPWLITRRAHIPVAVLDVWALCTLVRGRRGAPAAAFFAPQAVLIALLAAVNAHRFPAQPDYAWSVWTGMTSGVPVGDSLTVLLTGGWDLFRPAGLLGVLADRKLGLVWSNALLALLLPAALIWGVRRGRTEWPWLLAFAGVYVLTCGTVFTSFAAGTASHPPRYLVPVLPLLAVPLARMIASRPGLLRGGGLQVGAALGVSAMLSLAPSPFHFTFPSTAFIKLNPGMEQVARALPAVWSHVYRGPEDLVHIAVTAAAAAGLSWLAFGRYAPRISRGAFCGALVGAAALVSAFSNAW